MQSENRATAGILFILAGVIAISVNDLMIKQLSGGYPLHQMVFIRSGVGILFSLIIVQFEGGLEILKTRQVGLHVLRGLLIVISNMTYFAALAVLSLGEATALFFAAPLFITILSIPILGERVGAFRLSAVVIGFVGVIVMQRPWAGEETMAASRIVLLLPVVAALTYALNQVLTRKLGTTSKASAMAVYIQAMFILVSALFFVIAGDGRFAEGVENQSLVFLLRAWVWPEGTDGFLFLALGLNSAIVGYCISQAYRVADAATVAPFEYVGLPFAIFWSWLFWADLPALEVWIGIALIVASGLFVVFRERVRKQRLVTAKKINRRY